MLGFLDQYRDRERDLLVDRLAAASARLESLAGRLETANRSDGEGWTPHEVLAHIATVSKFYGMLTYKVGTGQITEVDLLETARLRDPAAEQLVQVPVADLVTQIRQDHQRTLAYLRSAPAVDMQRTADIGGGVAMSAIDIARMPLVAHLEEHVDHLERELA
jgi:hypothetical protein